MEKFKIIKRSINRKTSFVSNFLSLLLFLYSYHLTCLTTFTFIHSFSSIHQFIHSSVHSFIRSFIYQKRSFTNSLSSEAHLLALTWPCFCGYVIHITTQYSTPFPTFSVAVHVLWKTLHENFLCWKVAYHSPPCYSQQISLDGVTPPSPWPDARG